MSNDFLFKTFAALQAEKNKNIALMHKLAGLKVSLEKALSEINAEARIKHTGWFVLLKRNKDRFICVGIFNPDISSEDDEAEWDLALPIPDPDSIKEFEGW